MSVHAVVPFKRPGTGKSRFGPDVSRSVRAELASAMLSDVIDALRNASSLSSITIAARGGLGSTDALMDGITVVDDAMLPAGLNRAVAQMSARFGPDDTMLVVMADLPTLSSPEIDALTGTSGDVVIAPTHDGGTGGLLRRPHDCIRVAYGPRSAQRHAEHAAVADRTFATCLLPGFAHDVDTLDDLRSIPAAQLGGHTAARSAAFGIVRGASPHRMCACYDDAPFPAAT